MLCTNENVKPIPQDLALPKRQLTGLNPNWDWVSAVLTSLDLGG